MPQAIPYVVGAVLTSAGASAGAVMLATIATSAAVGSYQKNRAEAQARSEQKAAFRARNITLRGGVNPRQYALGTVRMGTSMMYAEFVGPKEEYLDVVAAITHKGIAEVVGVYLNDEFVAAADIVSQAPVTGKYSIAAGKADRRNFSGPATGATITLPYAPRSAGDVIAVDVVGTGDAEIQTPLTVLSVAGTVVTFTTSPAGTVQVFYTTTATQPAPIRLQFGLGSDTQAATSWFVSTPKWTSSHRLYGVSFVRYLLTLDLPVFATGEPNVSPVVRGPVGVYDPRTATTLTWSSNPALLAAWFRTLPREDGGFGAPSDWIDWPSVAAAANICDELITVRKLDGSGYETVKRYECNTVLTLDRTPEDNLQVILDAMAGDFPYTGGLYRCYAGAFRSATVTLTDDDIAADSSVSFAPHTGGADAPPNTVTGRFFNAAAGWNEDAAGTVTNSAYVTQDGGVTELLELDLPATTDKRQANYLMGVQLERRRPLLAGAVVVTGKGANIALLDTLQFDLANYSAVSGKTFEVRRRTNNWDGTYALELAEVKASTYALDADRFVPYVYDPVPDTSALWDVAEITGLASVDEVQAQSDGTRINRALISWTLHPQSYVVDGGAIELRYRKPGGEWVYVAPAPGSATQTHIGPLDDRAIIVVEARARNGLGAVSEWVGRTHQVIGSNVYFEDVANLSAGGGAGMARIAWDAAASKTYDVTELRLGVAWVGSTLLSRVSGTSYSWANAAPGTYTVWARHYNRSGGQSFNAASATFTVTAAGGGSGNVTFYQAATPAGGVDGDLWYETDNGNLAYRYTGGAWTPVLVGTAALADGAVTDSVPVALTASASVWASGTIFYQEHAAWGEVVINPAAGHALNVAAVGQARATITSARVSSIELRVSILRVDSVGTPLFNYGTTTVTSAPVYNSRYTNGSTVDLNFAMAKTIDTPAVAEYRFRILVEATALDSNGTAISPGGNTGGAGTGAEVQVTGDLVATELKR